MKRKKVALKEATSEEIIYFDNITKISKDINGEIIFEISNEITNDLAEGTAILMRVESPTNNVWDIEFDKNQIEKIEPQKCLYWLSGGDTEWVTQENYIKPWYQVYLDYQMEYGNKIISILEKSKTLRDIRNNFIKELNLPTLYEFALSKGFVKY